MSSCDSSDDIESKSRAGGRCKDPVWDRVKLVVNAPNAFGKFMTEVTCNECGMKFGKYCGKVKVPNHVFSIPYPKLLDV